MDDWQLMNASFGKVLNFSLSFVEELPYNKVLYSQRKSSPLEHLHTIHRRCSIMFKLSVIVLFDVRSKKVFFVWACDVWGNSAQSSVDRCISHVWTLWSRQDFFGSGYDTVDLLATGNEEVEKCRDSYGIWSCVSCSLKRFEAYGLLAW